MLYFIQKILVGFIQMSKNILMVFFFLTKETLLFFPLKRISSLLFKKKCYLSHFQERARFNSEGMTVFQLEVANCVSVPSQWHFPVPF